MRNLLGVPVATLASVLLVVLGIVLGMTVALALRHRVFLRLGLRNGIRRRGRTAVIVVGLMLGTAIIASALGTGDTMSRTIRSSVVRSLGATDELVTLKTAKASLANSGLATSATGPAQSNDLGYFPRADFATVDRRLAHTSLVDGAVPAIAQQIAGQNTTRRVTESRLMLFAPDPAHLRGFTPITHVTDGRPAPLKDLRTSEVYLDAAAASRLDAHPGDRLKLLAGTTLLSVTVRDIVNFEGSGSDRGAVLVPLSHAQQLLNRGDTINQILVSNAGDSISGATLSTQVRQLLAPTLRPLSLDAQPVKADGLTNADAQGDSFMSLFSTFGMFTIAAGILLIFLIFVMLAAERRSELGTERAIGMQRRDLIEVFLYEGLGYDVVAAAVGTALGLAIAYGMVEAVASAFSTSRNSLTIVHSLSWSSIAISYALGVLLTFAVVTFSAWRVSVLNIVTAIRALPDPARQDRRHRRVLIGTGSLGAAILLTAAGAGSKQGVPFLVGISLVIIASVVFALAMGAPSRPVYTVGGIALVGWWLLPFSVFRSMVPGLHLNFTVFVIGGLIVVLGATWVIIYNAGALNRGLTRLFGRIRSLAPVLRTSLAYPARNQFRTGVTIALFTLVVFTLVVGAANTSSFNAAFNDEQTFGGGFQVRADVAPGTATDLRSAVTHTPGLKAADFRVVAGQSFVPMQARQQGPGAAGFHDYPLRGLDDAFLTHTTFGFAARARGYGSDAAVWKAMRTTNGLAVVDALVAPRRDNFNLGVLPSFQLHGFVLEDQRFDPIRVDVRDPRTGTVSTLTVIGVLKETAPYTMGGLSTSARTIAHLGDRARPTSFYFQLAPGVDAGRTAKQLESLFLATGMQAQSTHDALQEVVSGSQTINNIVLGFLGLGLIIGVAALGVVSARSVVERREQIGVLRAIGFQRRMVQISFLLESTVIAGGAIVLGTVLGVVMANNVINDSKSQPSWSNLSLHLPWTTFLLVFGLVYAGALLATFVPARRAARTAPASALRYQ